MIAARVALSLLGAWTSVGGNPAHTGLSGVVSAQTPRPQVIGWPYQTNNEIESSPVVAADGTVYVGSDDGHVYALNPNGLLRWRFAARAPVSDPPALGPNGWVYAVDTKGDLYAIDPAGRARWRASLGEGAPSPVVSSPGIVYAGRNQGLDAITLTGRRLWHAPTGVVSGIGVGASGIAYVATQAGRLVAVDQRGRRRWSIGLGASGGIPTVAPGGKIYVGTMKGRFLAIDAHGRIRWSRQLSGDVEAAAALRPGGGVYIGSGLPLLRGSLDSFTAGGRRLWSFHTSSEVFSSPAVGADGTVYFGSGDAHVYALWPDGRLKWRYKAGKVIDSSPAIGPDGTLYIGSDDAFLYAFAPPVRSARGPIPTHVFTPAVAFRDRARLLAPGALAIGPSGRVFAADLLRYGIIEVSSRGRSIGLIGSRGRGPGRFEVPTGVAVDRRGRVLASDGVNGTVQEFVPAGTGYRFAMRFFRWRVAGGARRLVQPLALAVRPDGSRVYVGDARYGIVSFTERGRFLGSWSPGLKWTVVAVALGPGGVVYATFKGPADAQVSYRISPDLRSRHVLGLANPAGPPIIALDSAGRYYVLSAPPGANVTKFVAVPGGFQELTFIELPPEFAYGLAVDRGDRVFVPNFPNSGRPRGEVLVYSPLNPANPTSNYRLTRRLSGG